MILFFINSTSLLAQNEVSKAQGWLDTVPRYTDKILLASAQNYF